jgi:hypothetical protein
VYRKSSRFTKLLIQIIVIPEKQSIVALFLPFSLTETNICRLANLAELFAGGFFTTNLSVMLTLLAMPRDGFSID